LDQFRQQSAVETFAVLKCDEDVLEAMLVGKGMETLEVVV
jgi:hypothetical protein